MMSNTFPSTFTSETVAKFAGTGHAAQSVLDTGYRGIWYALGFKFEWGDKYSGGLGTYTANHQPMACYAPRVNKTYFTYGGTSGEENRQLTIMVSWFDHATGQVPQPFVLYFDPKVDDPHDNAAIDVDEAGYIWVFKSGRNFSRPGIVFRSAEPYSIDAFKCIATSEFTYPQLHTLAHGYGRFLLLTKYAHHPGRGPARNLYWKTSADGINWSDDFQLAAFDGHYQTSAQHQPTGKIATFFNWHPNGNVDARTNLYYAQTTDFGQSWTTADGTPLQLPLNHVDNTARVVDYQSLGKCMYTCDLNFDAKGNPVLLCIVSQKGEPGPAGDPRQWTILHFHDGQWHTQVIAESDHNYDMGSLYITGDVWKVIGPTEPGPQQYGTGGEMALWSTHDRGVTWQRERTITAASSFNHSYARRPARAMDPFYAFWADGDPTKLSRSHLYFCDSTGSRVHRLPYEMNEALTVPERLGR